jgi:hypothetical protein
LTGGACGILVDRSGSSDPQGFDAGRIIDDKVPAFLTDTGCSSVVFAPIDGNSRTSGCVADGVIIDPDADGNVDRQALWKQRREEVVVHAHQVLDCTSRQSPDVHGGTDVFGGLARIAALRPEQGTFSVLAVSDFINNDSMVSLAGPHRAKWDVSTPAARQALLDILISAKRMPSLRGIKIDTAGFGIALRASPTRYLAFDSFWHEYMKEAGCPTFRTT